MKVVDRHGEECEVSARPMRWRTSAGLVSIQRTRLVMLMLDNRWSIAEMATALRVTEHRVRQYLRDIRQAQEAAEADEEFAECG